MKREDIEQLFIQKVEIFHDSSGKQYCTICESGGAPCDCWAINQMNKDD